MEWLNEPTLHEEGPAPRFCFIRNNNGSQGGSCFIDFCGDEFCVHQYL